MSSTSNGRAVTVGLFIAIGLAILIVGIFTLGGQQKTFVKGIKITVRFSDVNGLIKGNNIWFSGVKIGTVKALSFSGIHQVDVEVTIEGSVQKYIHKNSGARISSEGFIGNKNIVIDGGSAEAPIIQDGDLIMSQKMLSTDDIMKTLQQNNQNLLSITGNFKKLSEQIVQGKGLVGQLMADTVLAIRFRGIVQGLQNTTQSTQQMAASLSRFSTKLNTRGGLADKALTDTTVFNRLQNSATQFQMAAAKANTVIDNLNKASGKLNTTDNALGLLLNDDQSAAQVKATLDNLQSSSVKLNDDLEAVQHNFLLRGFFKKKAKDEEKVKQLDSMHIAPRKIKIKN
ncbi:MlaD family protein [Mucilaginibacter sp.]